MERQVRAHHERVAEEDAEAGDPRAHEQEHEAPATPRRPPPGPSPIDCRGRRAAVAASARIRRRRQTPGLWAERRRLSRRRLRLAFARRLVRQLRVDLLVDGSEADERFFAFTLPACHFDDQLANSSWYAAPAAVIGVVVVCLFANIFRKVEKCRSGVISFECSDAFVVGTLRSPFESIASAFAFVARYSTSSHASACVLAALGDADDVAARVTGAVEPLGDAAGSGAVP